MRARRLVLLAVGIWVGRWLALELASFAGHRLLPPGPPPKDSVRRPGWMPTRFTGDQPPNEGGASSQEAR